MLDACLISKKQLLLNNDKTRFKDEETGPRQLVNIVPLVIPGDSVFSDFFFPASTLIVVTCQSLTRSDTFPTFLHVLIIFSNENEKSKFTVKPR